MSQRRTQWDIPEKRPKLKDVRNRGGRSRDGRPPGLRGREIGLYYKRLQGQKPKEIKQHYIKLSIPSTVLARVHKDLEKILNIAEELKIPVAEINTITNKIETDVSVIKKESEVSETNIETKSVEKEILSSKCDDRNLNSKYTIKSNFALKSCGTPNFKQNLKYDLKEEPSTSTRTEPVEESSNRLLYLRAQGEYKYGYKDIITGTFEEKLDESIKKGIEINKTTQEITDLSLALYEEYKQMLSNHFYNRMIEFRKTLPTYKKAKELLDVINNNQVVVISGETGCGKSTQVPQIILDNALCYKRGANVKILVTQPRRIAASSLASRVASERAEKVGNSIGYVVRLEKIEARPRGSILFCTTGVLLADLEVNQGLTGYSHIILDEVHERDCHIDMSMTMLKQILKKRKDLKLILMSATIDAERLSAFFGNCPMMHIEGLAYPVEDIYLEDILSMTNYQPEYFTNPNRSGKSKWKMFKENKRNIEKDVQYRAEIRHWLESKKSSFSQKVYKLLQEYKIEELDINLILQLLIHICKGPPGAVLIFLPGIGDITKLLKLMDNSNAFPRSCYEVYPLHSKLTSLDQHKIFDRPPAHVRKIIVATNIAETSITIDDVVYVIDCGKLKINGLNVDQNVSTLKTEWVSQANLRQRRGRAGRCQPGICYHLVTSFRAKMLQERLLPELQRSNLLETVLTIKKLRLGKAAEALMLVPDPPAQSTVEWAVKHLQKCGALDDEEVLTPLGWHLARLPVHPAAGKLLVLGALFGCLDRAASVAAVWGFKDPFQMVIGKETEVDQARRNLSMNEPSDHIAISEAIMNWECCPPHQRKHFAYKNFLSSNTLQLLSEMKKQFGDNLKQMGFLSSGNIRSSWENRNSDNFSIFKALIASALYPSIASVRWKMPRALSKPVKCNFFTPEDGRVLAHPSSVMAPPKSGVTCVGGPSSGNWLVYWLKQKSTDLYLIDVTLVHTLPLLFFGELIVFDADEENECHIAISCTTKVKCNKDTAKLLFRLRSLLDQVLASKVMASSDHAIRHSKFEEHVLNAVIGLITAEDEQTTYYNSDISDSDKSEY